MKAGGTMKVFTLALAVASALAGITDCNKECAGGCTVYNIGCPNCEYKGQPACGESELTKSTCTTMLQFKQFVKQMPSVGTCSGNGWGSFQGKEDTNYIVFTLPTSFYYKGGAANATNPMMALNQLILD